LIIILNEAQSIFLDAIEGGYIHHLLSAIRRTFKLAKFTKRLSVGVCGCTTNNEEGGQHRHPYPNDYSSPPFGTDDDAWQVSPAIAKQVNLTEAISGVEISV
jgi:hypothetical protein